jgi:hypothetical protein
VLPYLFGNQTICVQVLWLKKLASWKQFLFFKCLQQDFLVLDSKEITSHHHHPSQVLIILFANGCQSWWHLSIIHHVGWSLTWLILDCRALLPLFSLLE